MYHAGVPPLELLWSVFRAVTALLLLFHIVFVLALFVRRNDIVDAVWGIGFVVIAAVTFPVERAGILQWAVATMTCLWAVRLAAYILYRTHGQPEDYRYRQWREQWGKWWPLYTYVYVFLLQGALMPFVALPVIVANSALVNPVWTASWPLVIGVVLWTVGFVCETVADWQMTMFRKNRQPGQILSTGLWRYSRHPNYFGESLMWWGMAAAVCGHSFTVGGELAAWSMLAFVGPVLITFLLLRVSGVPLLERKYKQNPVYQEYVRRTSTFIPWFPKR